MFVYVVVMANGQPSYPQSPQPRSFQALLSTLDADERIRGHQFELICKWFLESEPEYRMQLRRVWLWNDWPDRFDSDIGIDLVAETNDGHLWAIQAKCRPEDAEVPKREIDSFLAAAGTRFTFRLLLTSAGRLGRHARNAMEEHGAAYLCRGEFDEFELIWPASLDALTPTPPKPLSPRPDQTTAIDRVVAELGTAARTQLHLPCGTGKTLISMWVWERLGPDSAAVLVPSLSLLSQTLRSWSHNTNQPFRYAVVCSDPSTVERDSIVASTASLGVPVTTDAREIESFVNSPGRKVVFSTYQSLDVLSEALGRARTQIGLLVCDEAHRTAGTSTGLFARALRDERLPASSRLFMTATPRILSRSLRRRFEDDGVDVAASMDDEGAYGRIAHSMTFGEAVGLGLLTDYQVVIVGVEAAEVEAVRRRLLVRRDQDDRVDDAQSVATQIALLKAMKRFDLTRVISFHSRIRGAKTFADGLRATLDWVDPATRPSGRLLITHVSGEMATHERDGRVAKLRSLANLDGCVITNARCLSEGIDVPALDGISFIDPRRSTTDIVQSVGRVMRRADGKSKGTIVLPVFVEVGDDEATALMSSSFATVWDVLRALRAHDSVLADQLDALRTSLGRHPTHPVELPERIVLDLPVSLSATFADALRIRLVTETTVSWSFWFGCLTRFVEEHGHAMVKHEYVDEITGRELGLWVGVQRTNFEKGVLSSEQAIALASLPGWAWSVSDHRWSEAFAELKRFTREFGHAQPHLSYCSATGFRLGKWVPEVRRRYQMGDLEPERVQQLESLESWQWAPRTDRWDASYRCLRTEMERKGLKSPPSDVELPSGQTSKSWISTQRRQYSAKRLSAYQVERLEELPGWEWPRREWRPDPTKMEKWVSLLEQYAAEHSGTPPYHVKDTFNGQQIGDWVARVRTMHRLGQVPDEFVARLSALPGWRWHPSGRNFDVGLSHLRALAERGPINPLPVRVTATGYRIANWVERQRRQFAEGTLTDQQQELLEEIPGWTWTTSPHLDT